MNYKNIESLIDSGGEVTIGSFGRVKCAATAIDYDEMIVGLKRKENESIETLLNRFDEAIGLALDEEVHTNEIN